MLTLSWGCSLGRWNSLLQMEENRLANSLMSPAPEEPLPRLPCSQVTAVPQLRETREGEGNEMVLSRGGPQDD